VDGIMYQVDERDRVTPLTRLPQSSAGAPRPVVVADEHRVVLGYGLQDTQPGWDGTTVRVVDAASDEPMAIVRFDGCRVHMFGPPNDEAFSGHPLASRGLEPHGCFEIEESSWIRRLERMNAVHPHHRPDVFWRLRHLIFSFHDSTFECICRDFDVRLTRGSLSVVFPQMIEMLG
jgi:hypothetical protein